MMADEFTAKLDVYLDGELPSSEMKALDAHVRSCPSCASDVLSRVQMKRALQSAGKRYQPSPEFRKRIQAQIARRPRPWANRAWMAASAVLATLLIAGLVNTYIGRQHMKQEEAFSEVADLHVAVLASANPVDVASSDRHTVKPWFQGKIPFTFNLPELQNTEFTLVGGRIAYLEQSPGAELIFQVRKHYVSVFIFQEHAAPALDSGSGVRKHVSFNYETWTEGGLRYVAISDTTGEDIGKLAQLLKAAARS
jgi:anti-sigma factor RsiW